VRFRSDPEFRRYIKKFILFVFKCVHPAAVEAEVLLRQCPYLLLRVT
jgi:hypothetical protein